MTSTGPDEYIHFIGCADQYQFCTPSGDSYCTPLTALNPLITAAETLTWANDKQKATIDRIILSLHNAQIFYSTFGRNAAALLANERVIQIISSSLPNNQWMIEVQEWFAVALARMQHALVEFVTGPPVVLDGMSFITMNGTDSKALCQAQIIRMPGEHQSFSVFGLALTVVLGLLTILLSLTIESIGSFVRTRWMDDPKRKRIQWTLDGKLQLLRMAEEYTGRGTWIRLAEDTPVSVERDRIFRLPKDLDLKNPGLRSLRVPSQLFVDGEEITGESKGMLSVVKEGSVAVSDGGSLVSEDLTVRTRPLSRGTSRHDGRSAEYELISADERR